MRFAGASRILALGWVVFLAACDPRGAGRETEPAAPAASRGLVLVTVDGLVPGSLALFGGATPAPALERLAREGRAWADGWSACPMTRPAVATYLTGLAPDAHGVFDDGLDRLGDDVPTLAALLAAKGYATAAFPDTSLLGADSGLLRGFAVVDDPRLPGVGAERRVGLLQPPDAQSKNIATWLRSLAPGKPFFAWIHSSLPERDQASTVGRPRVGEDAADEPLAPRDDGKAGFDRLLGEVLTVLDEVAGKEPVTIVVAGTYGDVLGGETRLPGPGFALDPHTLRVPIVARLQPAGAALRDAGAAVWAPDVAATLAARGGVRLGGEDGVALDTTPPADRPLHAWTRAPHDQLGWPALSAVRVGTWLATAGLTNEVSSLGSAATEGAPPLDGALAARPVPDGPAVRLDAVVPVLASYGLALVDRPREGRAPASPEARHAAALAVWRARVWLSRGRVRNALRAYERAASADAESLAGLVERGDLLMRTDTKAAAAALDRAVQLYPTTPEAVHWFIHAHWAEDWAKLTPLLEEVLRSRPHDGDLLYDVACARSKSGDVEGSEAFLRRSIDAGYRHFPQMESDPDLRALRESGRFGAIMRDYRR